MFYSIDLLSVKNNSKFGVIWLAATVGPRSNAKKLNRRDYINVDIIDTWYTFIARCPVIMKSNYLIDPPEPLSLRLISNMMIGVTRVYGQQYSFHYGDVQQFCSRLTKLQTSDDIDLPEAEIKKETITLKKSEATNLGAFDFLNDMTIGDFDLSSIVPSKQNVDPRSPETIRNELISSGSKLTLPSRFSASSSDIGAPKLSSNLIGSDLFLSDNQEDFGDLMNLIEFNPALPSTPNEHQPHDFFRSTKFQDNSDDRDLLDVAQVVPKTTNKKRKPGASGSVQGLFDQELMLNKDQLFLSTEEIERGGAKVKRIKASAVQDALDLLNEPVTDLIFEGNLIGLFKLWSGKEARVVEDYMDDVELYRSRGDLDTFTVPEPLMPWSSNKGDSPLKVPSSSLASPATLSDFKFASRSPSPLSAELCSEVGGSQKFMDKDSDRVNFLMFLQEKLAHKKESRVTFLALFPAGSTTRAIASRAFHNLLELASRGIVEAAGKEILIQIK